MTLKLPPKLTFEEVQKLLPDIKRRARRLKKVDITELKEIDIWGFQLVLSLKKSGVEIEGFEKLKEIFDFELELDKEGKEKTEKKPEKEKPEDKPAKSEKPTATT